MKSVRTLDLSAAFLADAEQRVRQQKETIARLKKQGRPTRQAERTLLQLERSVLHLQNHLEIVQHLLKPDPYMGWCQGRKSSAGDTP
jgi:hypothetical protein